MSQSPSRYPQEILMDTRRLARPYTHKEAFENTYPDRPYPGHPEPDFVPPFFPAREVEHLPDTRDRDVRSTPFPSNQPKLADAPNGLLFSKDPVRPKMENFQEEQEARSHPGHVYQPAPPSWTNRAYEGYQYSSHYKPSKPKRSKSTSKRGFNPFEAQSRPAVSKVFIPYVPTINIAPYGFEPYLPSPPPTKEVMQGVLLWRQARDEVLASRSIPNAHYIVYNA